MIVSCWTRGANGGIFTAADDAAEVVVVYKLANHVTMQQRVELDDENEQQRTFILCRSPIVIV